MTASTSFGTFAQEWDKEVSAKSPGRKATLRGVLQLLGRVKGRAVYEIACGNGFLARKLAVLGAKEVWASDIAKEMIEIAQTKYESKNLHYFVREATNFRGIPTNYFDAVTIVQGIFYVKNVSALLQGIGRILKPCGTLIFTVVHPLFPHARKITEEKTAMGEGIDDLTSIYENYLTIRSKVMEKNFDGKNVSYLTYKRPLSYYVNLCGKHKLYIEQMLELNTKKYRDGKLLQTNIPSIIILRAVKKT